MKLEYIYCEFAKEQDSHFIWSLRNDSYARKMSKNKGYINLKTHNVWFKQKINDNKHNFVIIFYESEKVGYARFDVSIQDQVTYVSINILDKYRNKGIGTEGLSKAIELIVQSGRDIFKKFIAEVREENTVSKKLFDSLGFILKKSINSIDRYELSYSKRDVLPSLLVDIKEGIIDLGWGHPSAHLHPTKFIKEGASQLFDRNDDIPLEYGATQGFGPFLNSLAVFLSSQSSYYSPVSANNLFLTAGASQGIDLACTLFTKSGDTVIVEEPTYFVVEKIFRAHDLQIISVPIDENGMKVSELKKILKKGLRPKFIYTIPTYQNPTGICMSIERKNKLIELSEEFDFLILADEVYQLIYFNNLPPPPFMSLDHRGRVISFGSFSKILAPGLRTGWIHSSNDKISKFSDSAVTFSGGGFNHFAATLIREVFDLGLFEKNIDIIRNEYIRRCDVMNIALSQYFGDSISYNIPGGGYYYWLDFKPGFNTEIFLPHAEQAGVSYRPGKIFSESGKFENFLRLAFTLYEPDQLKEGVSRLYTAYRNFGKS